MSKKAYSLRKCTPTTCYICLSCCCCCYRYSKPCVPLPTLVLFPACLQLTLPAVCPALQPILAFTGTLWSSGGLASGDTLPAWGTDVPLYRCGNGAPRGGRGPLASGPSRAEWTAGSSVSGGASVCVCVLAGCGGMLEMGAPGAD